MDIRFPQVFDYWAQASGTPASVLADRWSMDAAYEAHEIGAISFEDYCDSLRASLGIELSIDDWRLGWNSLFAGPFHDVVEAIHGLPDHVNVFGFTNTNNEHVACWRPRYQEPLSSFEKIYISSEIGQRKPDVAAYHAVCADIGEAPEQVLFFDDSIPNIEGARQAGLQTVHVREPADVIGRLASLVKLR